MHLQWHNIFSNCHEWRSKNLRQDLEPLGTGSQLSLQVLKPLGGNKCVLAAFGFLFAADRCWAGHLWSCWNMLLWNENVNWAWWWAWFHSSQAFCIMKMKEINITPVRSQTSQGTSGHAASGHEILCHMKYVMSLEEWKMTFTHQWVMQRRHILGIRLISRTRNWTQVWFVLLFDDLLPTESQEKKEGRKI